MNDDCEQKVRPFWLSWYHTEAFGAFELHIPWWVSGYRGYDLTICAAVLAEDVEAAREVIYAAYDHGPPDGVKWRFVTEQEPGWSPFCDRFERADWMRWPDARSPR